MWGSTKTVKPKDGKVTVTVGSSPVFIKEK